MKTINKSFILENKSFIYENKSFVHGPFPKEQKKITVPKKKIEKTP